MMTYTQSAVSKTVAILSVLALALAFMPALASAQDDSSDYVSVTNVAEVQTQVEAVSSTGGNQAFGSHGGDGGNGGGIVSGGDWQEVDDSTAGNGGDGGEGGSGGTVTSGDALVDVAVGNFVNTTELEIDRTGEEDPDDDASTASEITNVGLVGTAVAAVAVTGENTGNGSDGGNGGNGGSIDSTGGQDVEGGTAGNGGAGGAGSEGGTVESGASETRVGIISIVNSVITRIMR